MIDLPSIIDDLRAEGDDLDRLVADLPPAEWATPTPAEGWTVAHQIGHLAWTDDVARLSIDDPAAFADVVAQAWQNPLGFTDEVATDYTRNADLLAHWRASRKALAAAMPTVASGRKLDWFGPSMTAASMATARLMETWAHGQDVADALGVIRTPTARLRHVAHLGVRTRAFAYMLNDKPLPTDDIRVELAAPDGSTWAWGDGDAPQRVTGSAADFCLLVTQRRHLDDLDLQAVGPDAEQWLTIAQAFAGTPGKGRAPGQFAALTVIDRVEQP